MEKTRCQMFPSTFTQLDSRQTISTLPNYTLSDPPTLAQLVSPFQSPKTEQTPSSTKGSPISTFKQVSQPYRYLYTHSEL